MLEEDVEDVGCDEAAAACAAVRICFCIYLLLVVKERKVHCR